MEKRIEFAPLADDEESDGKDKGREGDGDPCHIGEPVHVHSVVGDHLRIPWPVQADASSLKRY